MAELAAPPLDVVPVDDHVPFLSPDNPRVASSLDDEIARLYGLPLEELRGLVQAAEVWVGREGDERASVAVERCSALLANPARASPVT